MYNYDAPAPERIVTLEEFERLDEEDEYELEVDRGWLVREPRPGAPHGWIQARLAAHLLVHIERERLGLVVSDTGVVLKRDPLIVRGPDISFIRMDRLTGNTPPEGMLKLSPDLAVEVISPSNTADQMYQKVLQYIKGGVRVVWVVHPRSRTVTEYRPDAIRLVEEHQELVADDVIPGFRLRLNELFAPLR